MKRAAKMFNNVKKFHWISRRRNVTQELLWEFLGNGISVIDTVMYIRRRRSAKLELCYYFGFLFPFPPVASTSTHRCSPTYWSRANNCGVISRQSCMIIAKKNISFICISGNHFDSPRTNWLLMYSVVMYSVWKMNKHTIWVHQCYIHNVPRNVISNILYTKH